jgi:hypothetical protein
MVRPVAKVARSVFGSLDIDPPKAGEKQRRSHRAMAEKDLPRRRIEIRGLVNAAGVLHKARGVYS